MRVSEGSDASDADANPSEQPAEKVYWARVATVDNGRWLVVLMDAVGCVVGFLPEAWVDWEPRYRVLVGRHGTDDAIGVRQARTRRAVRRQLAEVQTVLADSTAGEARSALELHF